MRRRLARLFPLWARRRGSPGGFLAAEVSFPPGEGQASSAWRSWTRSRRSAPTTGRASGPARARRRRRAPPAPRAVPARAWRRAEPARGFADGVFDVHEEGVDVQSAGVAGREGAAGEPPQRLAPRPAAPCDRSPRRLFPTPPGPSRALRSTAAPLRWGSSARARDSRNLWSEPQ